MKRHYCLNASACGLGAARRHEYLEQLRVLLDRHTHRRHKSHLTRVSPSFILAHRQYWDGPYFEQFSRRARYNSCQITRGSKAPIHLQGQMTGVASDLAGRLHTLFGRSTTPKSISSPTVSPFRPLARRSDLDMGRTARFHDDHLLVDGALYVTTPFTSRRFSFLLLGTSLYCAAPRGWNGSSLKRNSDMTMSR